MYLPSITLIALFIIPLVVGSGYVLQIKENALKLAYAYAIGIFIPSTLYFVVWLISGLNFNLIDWAIINIVVGVGGLIYFIIIKQSRIK